MHYNNFDNVIDIVISFERKRLKPKGNLNENIKMYNTSFLF